MKIISVISSLILSIFIFGCQKSSSIDTYLAELDQNDQINGHVLVVKNGSSIYERSFGYTDGSKTLLLTKDYHYNIGSIYKEFPAVAIMQLQERGSLKVEDKITTYLEDLPSWANQISIKHLLQYSSGLPKVNWDGYFGKGLKITEAAIYNDLRNLETLEFESGTDYLYTNYSPILLIDIVEKISGQRFADYLNEQLFAPNSISGFIMHDQYPYLDTSLMAIPFNEDFEEDSYEMEMPDMFYAATANGLYQWFRELDFFKILSKESVEFLSETAKRGDNIQAPLGRCVWENDQLIEHSHHGSMANYECLVQRFQKEDLTVVILTNRKNGNVHEIAGNILEIVQAQE